MTVVLALLAPPLGLIAWIVLSGGQRAVYLRSPWVRAGLATLAAGSLPLLAAGIATVIGLLPDSNPNPIGLGLLFVAASLLACVLTLIGLLRARPA